MDKMEKVSALAKRRGFVFPGSAIYGGLANTWDYGPLGSLLKRNIEDYWWDFFVSKRPEIYGLDTSVLMNPRVWEASGHTESFTDALIDCRSCKIRTRADHLIEDKVDGIKVEGNSLQEMSKIIEQYKIACPNCSSTDWTQPREFNLLFETHIGIVPEKQSLAYLRGETAQGMFINFKNVLDSMRPQLPFGLAQSGLVFRNEVTTGHFIFRSLEFHLAEFEYYVKKEEWKKWYEYWKKELEKWIQGLGVKAENIKWRTHEKDELSHYSEKTEDLEYKFPFGFKEWCAVAYRTNFDLTNHMEKSGVDLRYTDPKTKEKFIPHVIEPTFGISRTLMVVMMDAYEEEEKRVVLKLAPRLAPYKVAIFPLLSNKPKLMTYAKNIFKDLAKSLSVVMDDRGNIGKRYFAQDEIGTPWCVTVDFDTLKDDAVTIRDRDSMKQERVPVKKLEEWFADKLE